MSSSLDYKLLCCGNYVSFALTRYEIISSAREVEEQVNEGDLVSSVDMKASLSQTSNIQHMLVQCRHTMYHAPNTVPGPGSPAVMELAFWQGKK